MAGPLQFNTALDRLSNLRIIIRLQPDTAFWKSDNGTVHDIRAIADSAILEVIPTFAEEPYVAFDVARLDFNTPRKILLF